MMNTEKGKIVGKYSKTFLSLISLKDTNKVSSILIIHVTYWGAWLPQSEECVTLHFRVMSWSLTLGVEMT